MIIDDLYKLQEEKDWAGFLNKLNSINKRNFNETIIFDCEDSRYLEMDKLFGFPFALCSKTFLSSKYDIMNFKLKIVKLPFKSNITERKINKFIIKKKKKSPYFSSIFSKQYSYGLIKGSDGWYTAQSVGGSEYRNNIKLRISEIKQLPKTVLKRYLLNKTVDFSKDYDDFVELFLNGECEFYDIFGKDRCKIKSSDDLLKMVKSEYFNSGHRMPMTSRSSYYADSNISAVFLYHNDLITEDILVEITELVNSDGYNGKKYNDPEFLRNKLLMLKKTASFKNSFSETLKLYLEVLD